MSRIQLLPIVCVCLCACWEPRSQLVLYINTDLPVPRFADALRIDFLADDDSIRDSRTVIAANPSDWPVSFGATGAPGSRLRFRLLAYSSVRLQAGTTNRPRGAAIERLIETVVPAHGTSRREIVLGGDCVGVPVDLASGHTCATRVDGDTLRSDPEQPFTTGVHDVGSNDVPSRVGTWEFARDVPCNGRPRAATAALRNEDVCIRGGAFFLGDDRLSEADVSMYRSVPERLVRVSAFYMDRYEFTVGRYRALLAAGFRPGVPVNECAPTAGCTLSAPDNELLPINSVSYQTATEICAFDGGATLPTEAQWEFAASGRGEEWLYPWGNRPEPDCVGVSFAHWVENGLPVRGLDSECPGSLRHRAVGTSPLDATPEGIFDLSGNLSEWTLDSPAHYSDDCWNATRLTDPRCVNPRSSYRVVRGGNSISLRARLFSAFRSQGFVGDGRIGFRCVRSAQ